MSPVLVIAGPSGVGKGSIVEALCARDPRCWRSISMTTRPQRRGDRDGETYCFVTPAAFAEERAHGGFLESFEVFGNLYGTPRRPVEEHLAKGDTVVLEIDVQGALAVREILPDACLVFIAPPSLEVLRERLLGRKDGMTSDQLASRLAAAEAELAQQGAFDAVVVNDALDVAVEEVATLVQRCRISSGSSLTEP